MKKSLKNIHRQLPALLVATILAGASYVHAATIVRYEMGQLGPQTTNFVTGGDLTAGAGAVINANYNFGTPGFATRPVLQLDPSAGSSGTANAQDNGRNVFFDLTVSSGVTDLDLTSFSLLGAKNGSDSRAFGIGYQVNTGAGFGSRVDIVNDVSLSTERPGMASFGPYDLTTQTALQNLTTGTVVRFLVAEDNDFSASFDNFDIQGTGVIPEPSTSLLLIGGLGVLLMRRRRG